jgi:hypothetical protein
MKMTTRQFNGERVSMISSKSFEEVVAGLEAAVSRPHVEGSPYYLRGNLGSR